MAKRKSAKSKPQTVTFTDARPDPLYQAFKEYWRNVDAGKNHTDAAINAMVDFGIDMDDKHFRRCARRAKDPIAEIRKSNNENRDFKLIEYLVRKRYKEPVETWDQFEAAFHACGLPPNVLENVKRHLFQQDATWDMTDQFSKDFKKAGQKNGKKKKR